MAECQLDRRSPSAKTMLLVITLLPHSQVNGILKVHSISTTAQGDDTKEAKIDHRIAHIRLTPEDGTMNS